MNLTQDFKEAWLGLVSFGIFIILVILICLSNYYFCNKREEEFKIKMATEGYQETVVNGATLWQKVEKKD